MDTMAVAFDDMDILQLDVEQEVVSAKSNGDDRRLVSAQQDVLEEDRLTEPTDNDVTCAIIHSMPTSSVTDTSSTHLPTNSEIGHCDEASTYNSSSSSSLGMKKTDPEESSESSGKKCTSGPHSFAEDCITSPEFLESLHAPMPPEEPAESPEAPKSVIALQAPNEYAAAPEAHESPIAESSSKENNASTEAPRSQMASTKECIASPESPESPMKEPSLKECTASPESSESPLAQPSPKECSASPESPECTVAQPSPRECTASPKSLESLMAQPSLKECIASPESPESPMAQPSPKECSASPELPESPMAQPSPKKCIASPESPECTVAQPSPKECTASPKSLEFPMEQPSPKECTVSPRSLESPVAQPSSKECIASPESPECTVAQPSPKECTDSPKSLESPMAQPSPNKCTETLKFPESHIAQPSPKECTDSPKSLESPVAQPSPKECIASPDSPECTVAQPSPRECTASPKSLESPMAQPSLKECIASPESPECTVAQPSPKERTASSESPECSMAQASPKECIASPESPECLMAQPSPKECTTSSKSADSPVAEASPKESAASPVSLESPMAEPPPASAESSNAQASLDEHTECIELAGASQKEDCILLQESNGDGKSGSPMDTDENSKITHLPKSADAQVRTNVPENRTDVLEPDSSTEMEPEPSTGLLQSSGKQLSYLSESGSGGKDPSFPPPGLSDDATSSASDPLAQGTQKHLDRNIEESTVSTIVSTMEGQKDCNLSSDAGMPASLSITMTCENATGAFVRSGTGESPDMESNSSTSNHQMHISGASSEGNESPVVAAVYSGQKETHVFEGQGTISSVQGEVPFITIKEEPVDPGYGDQMMSVGEVVNSEEYGSSSVHIKSEFSDSEHTGSENNADEAGQSPRTVMVIGNIMAARPSFQCHQCAMMFMSKSGLRKHMKKKKHKGGLDPIYISQQSEIDYQCLQCDESFRDRESLRSHLEENNHGGTQPMMYSQESPVSPRRPVGSTFTPFSCPKCSATFSERTSLRDHMIEQKHGNIPLLTSLPSFQSKSADPHECPVCNKVYTVKKSLRRHFFKSGHGDGHVVQHNVASKTVLHVCQTCGKSFNTRRNLVRHTRRQHQRDAIKLSQQSSASGTGHSCARCGKIFVWRYNLIKHMKKLGHGSYQKSLSQSSSNTHLCHVCGKSFIWKQSLKRHRIKHGHYGEQPLDKSEAVGKNANLASSQTLEENEKSYKCHQCDKTFIFSSSLRRHMAKQGHSINNQQKPVTQNTSTCVYKCPKCKATYNLRNSLSKHMKVKGHRGEIVEIKKLQSKIQFITAIKYSCPSCSNVYKEKRNLYSHVVKLHGKKAAQELSYTIQVRHCCPKCDKLFVLRPTLVKHMRTQGHQPDAGQSTQNPKEKSLTKPSKDKDGLVPCPHCDKSFPSRQALGGHLTSKSHMEISKLPGHRETSKLPGHRETSKLPGHRCPQCKKLFPHRVQLLKHMIVAKHGRTLTVDIQSTSRYKCSKCKKGFSLKKKLDEHVRKKCEATRQKKYSCRDCGKEFDFEITLKRHAYQTKHSYPPQMEETIEEAKADTEYICECGKSFEQESTLKRHTAQTRHSLPVKVPLRSPTKPVKDNTGLVCKVCGKEFDFVSNLKRHELTHSNSKAKKQREEIKDVKIPDKYSCNECGKEFDQEPSLQRHVAQTKHSAAHQNNQEQPEMNISDKYSCNECGKEFSQEINLKRHFGQAHRGCKLIITETPHKNQEVEQEEPEVNISNNYSCNECGKEFSQEINLKRHFGQAHRGSKLIVTMTPKDNQEAKHPKTPKKNTCNECGKEFDQAVSLQRHVAQTRHSAGPQSEQQEPVMSIQDKHSCKECGKEFDQEINLKRHAGQAHRGTNESSSVTPKRNQETTVTPKRNQETKNAETPEIFTCYECGKEFEKASSLQRHAISTKHSATCTWQEAAMKKSMKPSCNECGKEFDLEIKLNRHVAKVHGGSKASVTVTATKNDEMNKPMSTKPSCGECGREFDHVASLQRHVAQTKHSANPPKKQSEPVTPLAHTYCCEECDKEFDSEAQLKSHASRAKHAYTPEVRGDTELIFSGKSAAPETIENTTSPFQRRSREPVQCPVCDLLIAQRCNLKRHMRFKHLISDFDSFSLNKVSTPVIKTSKEQAAKLLKAQMLTPLKNFDIVITKFQTSDRSPIPLTEMTVHVCKVCDEGFSSRMQLKKHSAKYKGSCQSKSLKLKRRDRTQPPIAVKNPNIHLTLKEDGSRIYKCDVCGKEFAKGLSLSNHSRSHKEGKGSMEQGVMEEINVTEEQEDRTQPSIDVEKIKILPTLKEDGSRIYKCDVCGKEFVSGTSLSNHSRTHKGGKGSMEQGIMEEMNVTDEQEELKCLKCEAVYVHKSSLKRHIEKNRCQKKQHKLEQEVSSPGVDVVDEPDKEMKVPQEDEQLKESNADVSKTNEMIATFAASNELKCLICGAQFRFKTSLRRHIIKEVCQRLARSVLLPEPGADVVPEESKESEVDSQTTSSTSPQKSTEAPEPVAEFKCPKCPALFKYKTSIRKHLKKKVCQKKGRKSGMSKDKLDNEEKGDKSKDSSKSKKCNETETIGKSPEGAKWEEPMDNGVYDSDGDEGFGHFDDNSDDDDANAKQLLAGSLVNDLKCEKCHVSFFSESSLKEHVDNQECGQYRNDGMEKLRKGAVDAKVQKEVATNDAKMKASKNSNQIKDIIVTFNTGQEQSQSKARLTPVKANIAKKASAVIPFDCANCSKQFPCSQSLKHHIEQYHPQKYRCDLCEKMFESSAALNTHSRMHAAKAVRRTEPATTTPSPKRQKIEESNTSDVLIEISQDDEVIASVDSNEISIKNVVISKTKNRPLTFGATGQPAMPFKSIPQVRLKSINAETVRKQTQKPSKAADAEVYTKKYLCRLCPSSFTEKANFNKHMKRGIHLKKLLTCHTCGKANFTGSQLYQHKKKCGEKKVVKRIPVKTIAIEEDQDELIIRPSTSTVFDEPQTSASRCPKCGVKFRTKKSLLSHIESSKRLGYCSSQTTEALHSPAKYSTARSLPSKAMSPRQPPKVRLLVSPSSLFVPAETVSSPPPLAAAPFRCSVCAAGFQSQDIYKEHLRIGAHNQCLVCFKMHSTVEQLLQHMLSHDMADQVKVLTDEIGKIGRKSKRHERAKDNMSEKSDPNPDDDKQENVDSHKPDDKGSKSERPYKCSDCLAAFFELKKLTRHIKDGSHHVCRICQMKFSSRPEVANHMPVHTNPASQIRHELKKHALLWKDSDGEVSNAGKSSDNEGQDKEEQDEEFKCTVCLASYNTKSSLTRHMKENAHHVCECCDMKFPNSFAHVTHVKVHHPKRTEGNNVLETNQKVAETNVRTNDGVSGRVEPCEQNDNSAESKDGQDDEINSFTHIKSHNEEISKNVKRQQEELDEPNIQGKGSDEVLPVEESDSNGREGFTFKCTECDATFDQISLLNRHVAKGKHVHSCTICQCKFGVKFELLNHMLLHRGGGGPGDEEEDEDEEVPLETLRDDEDGATVGSMSMSTDDSEVDALAWVKYRESAKSSEAEESVENSVGGEKKIGDDRSEGEKYVSERELKAWIDQAKLRTPIESSDNLDKGQDETKQDKIPCESKTELKAIVSGQAEGNQKLDNTELVNTVESEMMNAEEEHDGEKKGAAEDNQHNEGKSMDGNNIIDNKMEDAEFDGNEGKDESENNMDEIKLIMEDEAEHINDSNPVNADQDNDKSAEDAMETETETDMEDKNESVRESETDMEDKNESVMESEMENKSESEVETETKTATQKCETENEEFVMDTEPISDDDL